MPSSTRRQQRIRAQALRSLPLSRSCDRCRKRKTRCSGPQHTNSDNNTCASCLSAAVPCTYNDKYARRGPTLAYVDVLERRIVQVQTLLERYATPSQVANTLSEGPSSSQTSKSPIKVEPDEEYDVGLELVLPAIITNGINHPVARPGTVQLDDDFTWDELAEGMDKMSLNSGGPSRRLYGKSSGVVLVQDAQELSEILHSGTGMRPIPPKPLYVPQPWDPVLRKPTIPPASAAPFPFDGLARALFYLYFNHAAPFFLLLNRESFYDRYVDGLHLRDFHYGGIVATVCAIGALYSNPHDTELMIELSKGGPSPDEAWLYFTRAKNWVESYVNPVTLFELQFCALSCYHLRLLSRPHPAWILAGTGVRLAMDLGTHRWAPAPHAPEEAMRWRAAFGSLLIMDRELSVELGRSPSMHDEDSDYLGIGLKVTGEHGAGHGPSARVGEFLKRVVSLSGVFALTSRTVYSMRVGSIKSAEWEDKILNELNDAVDGWMQTLLPFHQWDPAYYDMVFLEQSAVLNCNICLLNILIHRPFATASQPSSTLTSDSTKPRSPAYTNASQICLGAALKCSDIVAAYDARKANDPTYESRAVHFQLEFAVFTSGIVLLEGLVRGGDGTDIGVLEKAVAACIRHVEYVGKKWAQSAQYAAVLSGVLQALTSPRSRPIPDRVDSKTARAENDAPWDYFNMSAEREIKPLRPSVDQHNTQWPTGSVWNVAFQDEGTLKNKMVSS